MQDDNIDQQGRQGQQEQGRQSQQDQQGRQDGSPGRRRGKTRPILTGLLYVAVLLAGIFAAWQANLWLRARRDRQSPSVKAPARQGSAAVRAHFAAGAESRAAATRRWTSDLLATRPGLDPLAAAGLGALDGDPGGLAPPDGARIGVAFQTSTAQGIQQQAGYRWAGDIAAAAEHYRRQLAGNGFDLVDESRSGPENLRLLATRNQDNAIVILRKDAPADKMVNIIVMVATAKAVGKR